jgi:hypothetical protein
VSLTRHYSETKLHLSADNPEFVYVMTCRDCSTYVADIERHDEWHQHQDRTEAYMRYIRGDGPFPERSKNDVDDENEAKLP